MTIKEVEQKTGLTAKSIRYYEDKKLINVDRNQGNSYRTYTEEHVTKLKWIKLFRYLDFSIQEINNILEMQSEDINKIFADKAGEYEQRTTDCERKKDICNSLRENYGKEDTDIADYEEIINLCESKEWEEMIEELKISSSTTMSTMVCRTLIFLGPIAWLFFEIYTQEWDRLMLTGALALIATVILTLIWQNYISTYKENKKYIEENARRSKGTIPMLLITVIMLLPVGTVVFVIRELLCAPSEWMFSQSAIWVDGMLIVMFFVPSIMVALIALKKIFRMKTEFVNDMYWIIQKIGIPVIIVWVVITYICISNVTYFTEDSIICCSPLKPKGQKVEYSDVSKVKTEFDKYGEFTYTIMLDENEIVVSVPITTVNYEIAEYEEDGYLPLIEVDQKLMELGIEKETSEEYAEKCDMAQEYVDIFLKIIRNETGSVIE